VPSCSCVGTTELQIAAFVELTVERRLDAVQAALSCGTGRGACRIEVERLPARPPGASARAA
jgi:bacterioferritin-associated ferredoxin